MVPISIAGEEETTCSELSKFEGKKVYKTKRKATVNFLDFPTLSDENVLDNKKPVKVNTVYKWGKQVKRCHVCSHPLGKPWYKYCSSKSCGAIQLVNAR